MRALLSVLLALVLVPVLRSQQQCAQSGGTTPVDACGTCSAQDPPTGMTLVASCVQDCRPYEDDCENCCFYCQGVATFSNGGGRISVTELGSLNQQIDNVGPIYAVSISVTLSCKTTGSEGTSKCVKFSCGDSTTGGEGEPPDAVRCFRLTCDICSP